MYSGGLPHANALVKAGHVAVHRFKLVAGYMGWDAGQLAREVRLHAVWPILVSQAAQGSASSRCMMSVAPLVA